MSLYIRGKIYWYRCRINGKYERTSTGKTTLREAKQWVRDNISELEKKDTPNAIYKTIQRKLATNQATFQEGFDFFLKYPRRSTPTENTIRQYRACWFDFAGFAVDAGAGLVSDVTEKRIPDLRDSSRRRHGGQPESRKSCFVSSAIRPDLFRGPDHAGCGAISRCRY